MEPDRPKDRQATWSTGLSDRIGVYAITPRGM